jgi:hypothetical protein
VDIWFQGALGSMADGLQATLPIRPILDDLDGVAEPTTELGGQHHRFGLTTAKEALATRHEALYIV